MDRAQVTAAPVDVVIGEKTYTLTPLSDQATGELDNWLRARVVRIARGSLDLSMSSDEKQEVMNQAFECASKLSWVMDPQLITSTPDGLCRFVYQMLKPAHPNITPEEVSKLIQQQESALDIFMDGFRLLQGGEVKKGVKKKKKESP